MRQKTKIEITILILRLTLALAAIAAIFYQSWLNLFIAILTMTMTFAPAFIEKKYKLEIPLDFEFAAILFIYASLFLGEVGNFYEHFWWWDILLHTSSAIAFACMGFIILFILFKTQKISQRPFWVAVFSFCFALSIGVIWEIFEYFMDLIFSLDMQKTGLDDTMWDLISDCAGGLLASFAGYKYIKGDQKSYLGKLAGMFVGNYTDSDA